MVLVGLFFCMEKLPQTHAGHGVVGKKQSGFENKHYIKHSEYH